ncbi:DUF960 domain-containing protein [Enterococcus mediterraneensis]|uniref:DUF960 domain-containing protein n=1 Tax=Enterococcus mediterraneensis TaxID=2364791 RepID=UPI000F06A544|nr:DUF960 domain-containing protein [Enterococcus mediterraneensis]
MSEKNKKRYLTKGINEKLPTEAQLLCWYLIDLRMRLKKPVDYLQIFDFQVDTNGKQVLIHRQEVPEYQYIYYPTFEQLIRQKIWMIDDGDYYTMLLPEEY